MVRKTRTSPTPPVAEVPEQAGPLDPRPPEIVKLLDKVADLLQEGQSDAALNLIRRSKVNSPWVTNAIAVCLLRSGDAARAIEVLRTLVLASGVCLRANVPVLFKTNYATALAAANRLSGCISILDEIHDEANPAVERLRVAIRRWEEGLSLWQRFRWAIGEPVGGQIILDFPPGDL
jgi:hypothetical protein